MSTPKYCDNFRPHAGHEWFVDHIVGHHCMSAAFYCWGVKGSRALVPALIDLEVAERNVATLKAAAIAISIEARRREDEFYGGDGMVSCDSCGGWCKWSEQDLAWFCDDCGDDWSEDDDSELGDRSKYRAPEVIEVDPICNQCQHPASDHEPVQRTDDDGNDYETYACPKEKQS